MKTYKVVYERDEDGWWIATMPEVQGVHSNGRTIDEARRRVRQALGAMWDDDKAADAAELVDDIRLPSQEKLAIKQFKIAAAAHEASRRVAHDALVSAVWTLTKTQKMSLRDVGSLVGVSHQKVKLLLAEAPKPATKKRSTPKAAGAARMKRA